MRCLHLQLVTGIFIFALSLGHAFKVPTHVASANRVLDELSTFITPGEAPDTIVFVVKGKRFELSVSDKEAYRAILDHQDFFRAGAIGPDGFPDIVTGQFWQHSNQNLLAQRLASNDVIQPIDQDTTTPWQFRHGPSEFRSVDFAMRLFDHLTNGKYIFTGDERREALAFVLGYFSHCIGDSFAHTWVNELAGGAWELSGGSGIFGPVTEEIKHIAIENLVDHRLPGTLLNHDGSTGGDLDRMSLRAPVLFLEHFFSSTVPEPLKGLGNKLSQDPIEWLKYYLHLDQFYGSMVFNYLNLQSDAARAIQQFTGLKPYMDWAAKYQPGDFLNILLDIVDWPDQVKEQFDQWFSGRFVSAITGGALRCELFSGGITGLDAIRDVWDYLGTFNARIRRYEERGKVVRVNWLRLSECTAQNLARVTGDDFDPNFPDRNRDACTILAEKPWADEGDGTGLYRGPLREGVSEDDDELLRDLRLYFRGANDDGDGIFSPQDEFEAKNRHRHIGGNLARISKYLIGFAFILDDLEDVIITDRHNSDFNRICALASNEAEERCINLNLLSYALSSELASCLKQFGRCTSSVLVECLQGLCRSACLLPSPICRRLCGAGEATCRRLASAQCELLPGACIGIPSIACWKHTIIYRKCMDALGAACGYLGGGHDRCIPSLLQCGEREVKCAAESLQLLFLSKGWARYLLNPIRRVCGFVQQARQFWEPYNTYQKRLDAAERHGVPIRKFNELIDTYQVIADKFRGFPPEYFVNIAFIYEDLRKDPGYLQDYLDAVERESLLVQMLPDGRQKELKEGAIAKLRRLGMAVGIGEPSQLLTLDFSTDLTKLTEAAQREVDEFGALIEMLVIPTIAGPTAKKILANIGPDFVQTFNPFFNTVQGMKLVGIRSRGDVEQLFEVNAVPRDWLPWVLGGQFYSEHCLTDGPISLYCDVFMSLDDPNCFGPQGQGCKPVDRVGDPNRFNWVPGRGMVVWNKAPTLRGEPSNVLTNFPLASSSLAYHRLYKRIFDVPQPNPLFAGFEDPQRKWSLPPGNHSGVLSWNPWKKTEGDLSLQIDGHGWLPLRSPAFDTVEFELVGDQLSVDVFVPEWKTSDNDSQCFGEAHIMANLPAAGIHDQRLVRQSLTSLPRGNWSTLHFSVSRRLKDALLGDFPNARFTLGLNLSSCMELVIVDNLQFTGNLTYRTVYHLPVSGVGGDDMVATNALLSFEDATEWWSEQSEVWSETTVRTDRNASLAVPIHGWTEVRSREFSTTELGNGNGNISDGFLVIGSHLNLDVLIPKPPSENEDWHGAITVSLSCPSEGINRVSLGVRPLSHVFQGQFDSLRFEVPPNVRDVLRRTARDCSFGIVIDAKTGTGLGSGGTILLDRLGFVVDLMEYGINGQ